MHLRGLLGALLLIEASAWSVTQRYSLRRATPSPGFARHDEPSRVATRARRARLHSSLSAATTLERGEGAEDATEDALETAAARADGALDDDYCGARYDARLVGIGVSTACGGGQGVFARRRIPAGARLATIPLARCLTADAAACDEFLGARVREYLRADRGGGGGDGLSPARRATCALLAHVRFGGAAVSERARRRFGDYVDALPWSPSDDAAVPARHRAAVETIAGLARVTPGQAYAALRLSRSRAMDLGRDARDPARVHALVPFADVYNHPAVASVREYLARGAPMSLDLRASLFDSTCRWYLSADRANVVVEAPHARDTPAGAELFIWYGDAGAPGPQNPSSEWDWAEHARFVEAYGFDPRV